MPESHVVYGKEAPTGLHMHTSVEESTSRPTLRSIAAVLNPAVAGVRAASIEARTQLGAVVARTVTSLTKRR